MGRYWYLKCPHCEAVLDQGWGNGDKFPVIGVPFFRCPVCGELIKTGSNEYMTLPVERRTTIRSLSSLKQPIKQSLYRTNSSEYIEFLNKHGFTIFSISDEDKIKYSYIDFENIINKKPSQEAIEQLIDVGILIDKDLIDPKTGGYRKDVLAENQKAYNHNRKIRRIAGICIIPLALGFTLGFSAITPALGILGLFLGLALPAAIAFLIDYLKNKKKQPDDTPIQPEKHKVNALPNDEPNDNTLRNIEYLKKLYDDGVISKEEYFEKVHKIIGDNSND